VRRLVAAAAACGLTAALCGATGSDVGAAEGGALSYAPVSAGHTLAFPADDGSHPQFRTEWWYLTGWLETDRGEALGFQITFFRTKPDVKQDNPSSFAPHQLLIAHCAISDPKRGRLWQDQRIRRAALGLADAREGDTDVWIEGWSLKQESHGIKAEIVADDFAFHLILDETQQRLINGEAGVSRKGPSATAASYYYSLPHLRVAGTIARQGRTDQVKGEAWFDHEWSSEYLDAEATGWDWIGINLSDGSALMAFQIRGLQGEQRWSGGTFRDAAGHTQIFAPPDIQFVAGRRWISPRTAISYPVEWHVRAGAHEFLLKPLLDDQENDTRLSTGAIYWEGAVRAFDQSGLAGRGYLELTGYGERLRLR
jgi:predicted secreted hydrolase